jgi:hypothetical protein
MRRAYARLESILPEGATIQNPRGYQRLLGGMYANRQVVAAREACGSTGNSPGLQRPDFRVLPIFETLQCKCQPIDLTHRRTRFQDTDPVWAD